MYTIRLKNGAEYAVNWCGASGGVLTIQMVSGDSLRGLAEAFSEEDATEEITFEYGEMHDVFAGYTQPIMLQDQRWQGGGVLVQMRRDD